MQRIVVNLLHRAAFMCEQTLAEANEVNDLLVIGYILPTTASVAITCILYYRSPCHRLSFFCIIVPISFGKCCCYIFCLGLKLLATNV